MKFTSMSKFEKFLDTEVVNGKEVNIPGKDLEAIKDKVTDEFLAGLIKAGKSVAINIKTDKENNKAEASLSVRDLGLTTPIDWNNLSFDQLGKFNMTFPKQLHKDNPAYSC